MKPDPHNVYMEQLRRTGHGIPLYEPDPATAHYDKVRPGDVGHIFRGCFFRLFNIFADEDDTTINNLGVPEDFEPFVPLHSNFYDLNPLPAGAIASTSVTVCEPSGGVTVPQVITMGGELKFSCRRQLGAVLLIDRPAERKDVMFSLDLKYYTAKNCRSWLRFARETLRRDLHLRDLLLVTGRDLASRWAMATFFDRTFEGDISFSVGQSSLAEIRGGLMGSWSSSISIPARCGPVDRTSLVLDTSNNDCNQCIFIRAVQIRERGMMLPLKLKAAAEPDDLGGFPPPDARLEVIACEVDPTGSFDARQWVSFNDEDFNWHDNFVDTVADQIFENSDVDLVLLHDLGPLDMVGGLDLKDLILLLGLATVTVDGLKVALNTHHFLEAQHAGRAEQQSEIHPHFRRRLFLPDPTALLVPSQSIASSLPREPARLIPCQASRGLLSVTSPRPQILRRPWSYHDLSSLEARIDTHARPTAGPLLSEYPPTRCYGNQMGESWLGEHVGDRVTSEILGETQSDTLDDDQPEESRPSMPLIHALAKTLSIEHERRAHQRGL